MKIKLLFLLLLVTSTLFSQKIEKAFGKIEIAELTMDSYENDPNAKAVILFDRGESIFFEAEVGYDIRFTRHKRVKIFDKSATEHTEVSIPYYVDGYGRTEEIKDIKAITFTYNNGNVIKRVLEQSAIYDEKINEHYRRKKFVFPNVQNGSIIELEYTHETPFHFNLPDWTFQDKIPTVYSEYQVKMIPFYEYVFIAQGIDRFDYQNSEVSDYKRSWGNTAKSYGQQVGDGVTFQDYIHTYALKDIPAFKDESFISSVNDYIIQMDFQLAKFHSPNGTSKDIITTWPELNKTLLKENNFGKYIKGSSKYAKKILSEDLNLNGKSTSIKTKLIAEYVKNNFTWDGYNSKYAYKSPKEFHESKTGNAAEINLFLIALYNEAEIPCNPLILSTRSHGKINSDYPFDHFTNYVIAFVDTEQKVLVDATENKLSYDKLPPRCINGVGLIVNESKESQWVSLATSVPSVENTKITFEINPELLVANVDLSVQSTEYIAFRYRSNYQNDEESLKKLFLNKIDELIELKTFNYERYNLPYSITLNGKKEIEQIGDNLVLKPFLNLSIQENKLVQTKRSYPVDFIHVNTDQFEIIIKIPEGYKITDLPRNFNMNNDIAEINLNYNIENDILNITGDYTFKKPVYRSNEYPRLKSYIDFIVKYFNENIVLNKS